MRVLFRADSSLRIGSGHLRRCLALADGLSRKGATCVFVARDHSGSINSAVTAAHHRLIELPGSDPASETFWERDASETLAAVADLAPFEALVVDHYALDARWEQALQPLARRCAIIDDLANRPHHCDMLIDVTPGEDRAARYEDLTPQTSLALLGPRYALLRAEFRTLRGNLRNRDGRIRRILVSFGATDQDNRSLSALRAIRAACGTDLEVDIVLGGQAPHLSLIADSIQSDSKSRLHIDTSEMAALMAAADLAIGAGGTTSWERASLGLPAIVTVIADNQLDNIEALVAAGAATYVPNGDQYEARLRDVIAARARTPERVRAMSDAARQLTDGKGADRVATLLLRPTISLRPANAADRHDVWQWRNEPNVRRGSNTTDPIDWESHGAWFEATLGDPNLQLLIGESGASPIGVLRFDFAGNEAAISVYLTPTGHGRGAGPEFLMQGQLWLQHNRPQTARIVAQINAGNDASIAAFAAARYRPQGARYVRDLSQAIAAIR